MKTLKIIIVALFATVLSINSNAQSSNQKQVITSKTETIKVSGNCESCQARIEKAAKVDGVTQASWNKDTKLLTLVYNPAKTSGDDIQKKIAAVGHDTEKYEADDKVYAKLPSCCKYR